MSDDLVSRIDDLIVQATKERSHYYTASVLKEARLALTGVRAEIDRLRESAKGQLVIVNAAVAGRNAAESELATLHDMLILCGELGGVGKDEAPADYLRRLIDEVAGVESLRARVREVVEPFAKAGELFGPNQPDIYDEDIYSPAAGDEYSLRGSHLRAARQLMEDLK